MPGLILMSKFWGNLSVVQMLGCGDTYHKVESAEGGNVELFNCKDVLFLRNPPEY